jgi:hypothetical protein
MFEYQKLKNGKSETEENLMNELEQTHINLQNQSKEISQLKSQLNYFENLEKTPTKSAHLNHIQLLQKEIENQQMKINLITSITKTKTQIIS